MLILPFLSGSSGRYEGPGHKNTRPYARPAGRRVGKRRCWGLDGQSETRGAGLLGRFRGPSYPGRAAASTSGA